jgi:restriction system protein
MEIGFLNVLTLLYTTSMPNTWLIRAGKEARYFQDFIENEFVGIGWVDLGELDNSFSKESILHTYQSAYPNEKKYKAQNAASQIYRFFDEIKVGDTVVTYDREHRIYFLGAVLSDAQWEPETHSELPRIRKVRWLKKVEKSQLTSKTLNSLGSIMAFFKINEAIAKELTEKAIPISQTERISKIISVAEEPELQLNLLEKAEEGIEDRILQLDWEKMQDLVAGILQAMGYCTTVSPRGADRGVDIFASPDGLGLEEPRIFVEVKHRPSSAMGSQEIRSFLGGRNNGDKCLYVSTGGFTQDARYEADRAAIPVRLIGLLELRQLYVEHYPDLDEKTRSLVPLQRVYVVAE